MDYNTVGDSYSFAGSVAEIIGAVTASSPVDGINGAYRFNVTHGGPVADEGFHLTSFTGAAESISVDLEDVSLYRIIPLSIILGVVVIFTVLGNLFVICAVYYEHSLRNITNMFVVSYGHST